MKNKLLVVLSLYALCMSPSIYGQSGTDSLHYEQALVNGGKANAAFRSGLRNTAAWLSTADPLTLLVPDRMGESLYTPHNSSADNYPFMVLSSFCADRSFFNGTARRMLFNELRYASLPNGMPVSYDIASRKQSIFRNDVIFGAAEYVKDGLIPITELIGPSIWSERMIDLIDRIIENSHVPSDFGFLPSEGSEESGEILQAVTRVYSMTGEPKYLDFMERIGDAWCFEVLPRNYGLPAYRWNFSAHEPVPFSESEPDVFSFSDHGNEILSGLVQLFITMKHYKPGKARAYYGPVKTMLDRAAETGMMEDGLFHYYVNPRTGKPIANPKLPTSHAWGYVYLAYMGFYQATGEGKYLGYLRNVLDHLDPDRQFWWTVNATAFSDVIEGVLYLINRIPNGNGFRYVEEMTEKMLKQQKPGGEFERWYGDGNVTRTALMYALFKTRGIILQPWHQGLVYGAVSSGRGLFIAMQSDTAWKGTIFFDYPRHREIFHLPGNYARINEFPEWFTVEPFNFYTLINAADGTKSRYPGLELKDGIDVELKAGEVIHLKVIED